jgi:phosphoglycolate phosphatase
MCSSVFPFILFDLDGTLVDSLPGISYSFREALSEVFPGCLAPEITHLIGPHIREIFLQAVDWEITSSELDALEVAYRRSYDNDGCFRTKAYPEVIMTLVELVRHGVECSIVTNKPLVPTKAILSHLELERFFVEIVTRDSRTPHFASKTEAVHYFAQRQSYRSEQTLFVGDSRDDALAAHAAGYRFAAADYGFGLVSRHLPDLIDFHLADFASLLQVVSSCDPR